MSDILRAAIAYAQRGYYVYPVTLTAADGKKTPDFPGSWAAESTRDLSKLDALFAGAAGLAIDTGKSGVVVIDVDVSGGKDGYGNLDAEGIELPETSMTADTWSGGKHLFFRQPGDPVGSASNRPVRDVDHRGLGGIVFAAPTGVTDADTGETLGVYSIERLVRVDELPVLPEAYAVRIRKAKPEPRAAPPPAPGPTLLRQDQRDVLEGFIETDLRLIREARSGERNQVLGTATSRLADRCRKVGFSFEAYEVLVLDAYRESGGTDDGQALNWCRSSWERTEDSPLAMPTTDIDRMADERATRMLADRLARQRVNGASARFLDESSFVDWSQEPGDARYWIDGVIPQGEQVVLYGKPEAGKTFLALDWSLSIVTGRSTFGRAATPGKVLFMPGEGNARLTSRIHSWIEHHGARPERSRLAVTNHVPDVMNDQVIENLAVRVAESEYDVVWIDTLGRAMSISGGDPGAPADIGVALKNLAAISRYRPSTTTVVLHHPIKDGSMAGAYNLLAGVDVSLHAEVDEDTHEGTLRFAKNKDGEKGVVQRYRWQKAGRSAVLLPTDEYQPPSGVDGGNRGWQEVDPFRH